MGDNEAIPEKVLKAIKKRAREEWPDDLDMIASTIDEETAAYLAYTNFDFAELQDDRIRLIRQAKAAEWLDPSWEHRLESLQSEVDACRELSQSRDGVPNDLVRQLRTEAKLKHPDSYPSQLEEVSAGVARWHYVSDLRSSLGPIAQLVIEMERIIGGACFNHSIQNYGPWGVWEGEGRAFRYPITFVDEDRQERKKWTVTSDMPPELLITGFYKFGANELGIVRSMVEIIRMIEATYGVDLSDKNKNEKK